MACAILSRAISRLKRRAVELLAALLTRQRFGVENALHDRATHHLGEARIDALDADLLASVLASSLCMGDTPSATAGEPTTQQVLLLGDDLEMRALDALADTAEMVHLKPLRDEAVVVLVVSDAEQKPLAMSSESRPHQP